MVHIPRAAAAALLIFATFVAGCSESHTRCTRCGAGDSATDAANEAATDASEDGGEDELPPGRCRSQTDCTGNDESCRTDDTPGVCGIPCDLERSCEPTEPSSCPDPNTVCVEYIGGCCFNGERSAQCAPKCSADSCAADEVCTAAGRCEAKSCADGFACATDFTCDPDKADAIDHGCVRNACTTSATCAGGFCVLGACFRDLGVCTVFLPVP